MSTPALLIRPSNPADLPRHTAIYGWNVLNGTGIFEPTRPEKPRWRAAATTCCQGLAVAGRSAWCRRLREPLRPRKAYRFCLEDSSTAPEPAPGLGKLLLAELLGRCEAAGARQMLAVIGDWPTSADRRTARWASSVGVMKAV